MPHECVDCGDVFEDGADEVFEGCPSCGATKFFYVKEVGSSEPDPEEVPDPTDPFAEPDPTSSPTDDEPDDETLVETQTASGADDIVEAESEYDRAFGGRLGEDTDDPPGHSPGDDIQDLSSGPSDAAPKVSDGFRRARREEAKERLMEQFETIRIVEPGSYELNLMNLYDSEEKIIALQEDGRYQVSLPSTLDD